MSTARVKLPKKTVPIPATREELETLVASITENKLSEAAFKAEMDTEMARVKAGYVTRLSQLADNLTPMVEAAHAWAESHPADFSGRRSLDLLHGVIGYRISPPAIKPLKGYTWAAVLDRLRSLGRVEFIRVKEEPNKEQMLASREVEDLKTLFCEVTQEDEFYVEPKITPTTPRETR